MHERTAIALLLLLPMSAAAQHHVSQASSPRFQLTGDVGVTAAFDEEVVLAATTVDARFYSAEGLGALLRVGYEGLLYLNFGAIDAAFSFRAELPGGQWAGLGLSLAFGGSAMIRDSVYHFTGDDTALALFTLTGIDVRLGSFLIGLDLFARRQFWSAPLGDRQTRPEDWWEAGLALRIGGEVLL